MKGRVVEAFEKQVKDLEARVRRSNEAIDWHRAQIRVEEADIEYFEDYIKELKGVIKEKKEKS